MSFWKQLLSSFRLSREVKTISLVGTNNNQHAKTSHYCDRGICRGRPKGRLRMHSPPAPLPVLISSRALRTGNVQRLDALLVVRQHPGNRCTLGPRLRQTLSPEHAVSNAWRCFPPDAEASGLRACRADIPINLSLTFKHGPPTSPPGWGWPPATGPAVNHLTWPCSKVLCFTIRHRKCGMKQTDTRKRWQNNAFRLKCWHELVPGIGGLHKAPTSGFSVKKFVESSTHCSTF